MSRILIAYATGEGQTGRIAGALANQFEALGHTVQLGHLTDAGAGPDPAAYDAVLVAASVHAGRHQKAALRFVRRHRPVLQERPAAFLSVSLLAAATKPAGLKSGREQVETFLNQAGWHPPVADMVGGAFRPSQLSWFRRAGITVLRWFVRGQLDDLGWPTDFTGDQEFTNWVLVHRFGERFAATLPGTAPDTQTRIAQPA